MSVFASVLLALLCYKVIIWLVVAGVKTLKESKLGGHTNIKP